MAIDFQPDLNFEPDDTPVAKGPNDWSKQYKKYTDEVKQRRQRTPIPGSEEYDGTPAMSYEDFVKSKEKKQLDMYIGGAEAGLSMISGIPATIGAAMSGISAPINPLAKYKNPLKQFEYFLADNTYSPRTDEGQRIAEKAGHFMQAFPAVGSYVHVPRVGRVPKPPKVDPVLDTLRKTQETPKIDFQPEFVDPDTSGLRLESPVAADIRVNQQNRRLNTADDFNNRDANVRAVEEEIAAKEALDAQEAMAAEQTRLAEVDHWRNNAKQDSIVEDFGSNDPLSRMPEMRVDENGIPIRADLSMEAANLENPLQRNLWGDELPYQTGDGGIPLTQALDNMQRGPDREIAIANLRGHQEINRIKGIENSVGIPDNISRFEGEGGRSETPISGLGRGQRGAMDLKAIKEAFESMQRGVGSIEDYLRSFKGTFDESIGHEMSIKYGIEESFDPKSRVRLMWMSPEDFHKLALPRDKSSFAKNSIGEEKRSNIKEGLKSKEGLTSVPMLKIDSGKIIGHEGRHRMDVFKEMGLTKVPVLVRDTIHRNESGPLPYRHLISETGMYQLPIDRVQPIVDLNRGLKRGQGGALDFKAIEETARKIGDNLGKIGTKAIDVLTHKEKVIPSAVRGQDYIPKGHSPENIIAAALAEGKDGPSLNQYLQSGLQLAGEKANSQLQIGVARWLSWAEKMATKSFRDNIKPLEQTLSRMNRKELNQAWSILKDEMFNRAQYGVDVIRNSGASERVIAAYEGLRKNFDDTLNTINEYRAKIGKEPITKQAAYLSSQWNGNYHVPLYDSKGRLVWYIKTTSAREARKALKWIGENHPDIDVSKSKPQYKPSELSPRIPKDITDVVSDMIKLFGEDSEIAKEMAAIVEEAKAAEAYNSRGFKVHFEEKANIRGFLGDRPWLSDHENAVQGMKAQIQYLKDAQRWAPMQEALANVKQVLGNEELIAQQPNNMAMAKAYTANALGVTKNIFKPAENAAARILGTSPVAFTKAIGDMKSITYLQLLGASTGYAIATPLQAFILGPSRHMLLSADGYKHNPLGTLFASISDGTKIVLNHEASANFTGKPHDIGLTPFGKEAKIYMEENGIATINLFDEYSDLGEHRGVSAAKKLLGFTISVPEKIARSMTFMSFAHHLNDGGFKGSKAELFRKAEELTDDTLTKFTKSARPLAVDAAGMAGELAYTFQSPLFNYYNNLGLLARNAKTNPVPLLMAAVVMPVLLGGTNALPGLNEADGAWNLIKGLLAKYSPSAYNKVKDFGIREFQLEHLPDWATHGTVSQATGTQMSTRFSTQAIDVEKPFGKIGPVPTAIGNWAQIPGAIGGETAAKQALWSNAPPIGKGIVEGTMDRFKAGPERADGRQPMLNPNRLSENVNSNYPRSKEDKIKRMFGLTSLDEARSKEVNYLNSQESKRAKTARETAIDRLWDGVMTKNDDKVQYNARVFLELYGSDTELESAINRKMADTYLTQQEREVIKANTLAKVMNLKRRLQMEK